MNPTLNSDFRQRAVKLLARLNTSATPQPIDGAEQLLLDKRAELSAEVQAIEAGRSALGLEEAAARLNLLRTQLQLLQPRFAGYAQARENAVGEAEADAEATRNSAASLLGEIAADFLEQHERHITAELLPYVVHSKLATDYRSLLAFFQNARGRMLFYKDIPARFHGNLSDLLLFVLEGGDLHGTEALSIARRS
jgi:hypothetical protein